jgi:uncharacterized protein YhaN
MLIKKLKINYFGRFNNKEIELKPGINLIYGDNEAGKSTIHTFVKGMFFGIERMRGRGAASKEDLYTRYLPWDYPGAFGGSMDIEVDGKQYRLQRSFHVSDKSFSVIDLLTGREIALKEGLISELIPGFSEATFKNTISIEQLKAQTDSELATQVRNFIANLSVTRSKEVNVTKAISFLTEQKKQLEPTLNPAALKTLQAAIEEGEAKEKRMDQLTQQLRELQERERELLRKKEELSSTDDSESARRTEQFPAILEKYRSYEELHNQVLQMEQQIAELKLKVAARERQQPALEQIKLDKKAAEAIRSDLILIEKEEREITQALERVYEGSKKAIYYSIPGAVAVALLIAFLSGFQLPGLLLAAGSLLIGGACYILLNRKNNRYLHELKNKREILVKRGTDVQNELMDILTRHQVVSLEGLADKAEEMLHSSLVIEHAREQLRDMEERKSRVQDNMDSIYDTIMTYLQYFIRADELIPETMQRITEELRLRKQESQSRQAGLNESYEECRLQIEKLRWEISTLEGNDEELQRNRNKYDQMKLRQAEDATELEAIRLALSTIEELSSRIHDSFGQQLNHTVSEVIGEVTGQRYHDIKVDEKLDIKLGWNDTYVQLERLSAGTIDQVYFALRLAVADLLLGKDEVPLLFDDSFALYDETRVKAALTEVAKRQQSILFTCHKREQRLLEELELPYHIVRLS